MGGPTGDAKDSDVTVLRYCEIERDSFQVHPARADSVIFFVHDVDDPHSTQGWKVEKIDGSWVLCAVTGPVVLADLYEP